MSTSTVGYSRDIRSRNQLHGPCAIGRPAAADQALSPSCRVGGEPQKHTAWSDGNFLRPLVIFDAGGALRQARSEAKPRVRSEDERQLAGRLVARLFGLERLYRQDGPQAPFQSPLPGDFPLWRAPRPGPANREPPSAAAAPDRAARSANRCERRTRPRTTPIRPDFPPTRGNCTRHADAGRGPCDREQPARSTVRRRTKCSARSGATGLRSTIRAAVIDLDTASAALAAEPNQQPRVRRDGAVILDIQARLRCPAAGQECGAQGCAHRGATEANPNSLGLSFPARSATCCQCQSPRFAARGGEGSGRRLLEVFIVWLHPIRA